MAEPPKTHRPLRTRIAHRIAPARRALPFISGMLAAFLGMWLSTLLMPPPPPLTQREVNDTVAEVMAAATPAPPYSALVYEAIRPSLVLIEVTRRSSTGEDDSGLGTGVVVNDQGAILTSLHVVANPAAIQLIFADGTRSPGQIVAEQPENDIAVVQAIAPPEVVYPAVLGNPGALRVGDEAFVVGHPYGLYGSMSAGVISGFERSFQPENGQRIEGLIQIDTAVNPGNSGGPLLNRYGQVVGIVTGLVNPTEQDVFIGIGLAVPINIAGPAAGLPPY